MIQTVHNAKLAEGLNKAWEKVKAEKPESQQLNVLIQINTSGEDGKLKFRLLKNKTILNISKSLTFRGDSDINKIQHFMSGSRAWESVLIHDLMTARWHPLRWFFWNSAGIPSANLQEILCGSRAPLE